MKQAIASLKYLLTLLVSVSFMYTSCKKADSATKTATLNAADLSKQMAISLYKSLSGQYGGADISDGIKAPLSLSPVGKGPRVNSVSPYCGLVIDTSYNFNEVVSDTVKSYFGHYKFTYGCTAGILDSYVLDDSIANTVTYQLYAATYKLTQRYFVKALDRTYRTSAVEGNISFSAQASLSNQSHSASQYHNSDSYYVLHNVKVDISSGTADVIEGTATFTARIKNLDQDVAVDNSFNGTITFSGHRVATVLIHLDNQTKTYQVNLLTGEVKTI